jgi:heavy metal efflux system protein
MLERILEGSLRFRGLVLVATVAVLALGVATWRSAPVDAFPDVSPVMVPVFAEAHGMAPEEVERLISWPIESSMNGLPGVRLVKSTSAFGMAVVYVYFDDDVDIYFARQLVDERLTAAEADLPELHEKPTLGPISTGLGQIFIYTLTMDAGVDTGGRSPDLFLREINDRVVKYQLQTVRGVTDVLSMGGNVQQYQVAVDPWALQQFDLSLADVVATIRANNRNVGGQFLVLGSEEHLVRGVGLLDGLDDIRLLPLRTIDGTPVRIGDVAQVDFGPSIRRGVVTHDGLHEEVSGIVLKLYGENTSEVIERLYERVEQVREALPEGVHIDPYYEQAELVDSATRTMTSALLVGAALVVLVLTLFLGDLRSSAIVALALPLSAATALICMVRGGVSANLMSLGGIAIAIGMLGDGAIVMVENVVRHLRRPGVDGRSREAVVLEAAREVATPIAFSIAIIVMVFLPLFALEGVEGRMFSPMAFTVVAALLGSLVAAIVVAPVLSALLLRQGPGGGRRLLGLLQAAYRPLLAWAQRRRAVVFGLALAAFVASAAVVPTLGTEFVPTLEEGSIFIGVTMTPSVSLDKATSTVMKLERRLAAFAPVDETVSRIGRPEAGSHPHPVNYAEIHVELKPADQWGRYEDKEALVEAMSAELSRFPGVQLNFSQPIQNLFDELLSGTRTELAIKLYGEDLDLLRSKAGEVREAIEDVPGLVDLSTEQSFGQPQVQVVLDREACARFGVDGEAVLELVELAIGGEVIDDVFQGVWRYGIQVRYQERFRDSPEAIEALRVPTADGGRIPLSQVADVRQVVGPVQINREDNQRRWVVQANIRGRDLGSVVADVRQRIDERVDLEGLFFDIGGQFENQQRAMRRLSVIVPLVIAAVFVLLWMSFGVLRHAVVVAVNLPLALVGGVLGLLVTGEYLSVPASVGFIALLGIAVQNGVVLVACFGQLRDEGVPLAEAIEQGAMLRLRPVLMTAATTVLGLMPLLLATGIGSEVQRPLAAVVIFGLATSTALTLLVLPAVYSWVEERAERAA